MRRWSLFVVFVMMASVFALSIPFASNAGATTLFVGGGGLGNYTMIQEALSDADDGDTVFVFSGTYSETVTVYDTVSLIGEDRNTTIINGAGDEVLRVYHPWTNVTGFTISNAGSGGGVYLQADHCIIANNSISHNEAGGVSIYLHDHNVIINNDIMYNQGGGLGLYYAENNTVAHNNFHGNDQRGISFYVSRTNEIAFNDITGSTEGVSVKSSRLNTITHNDITNNTIGILIDVSSYNTISDNDVSDNWEGIRTEFAHWNRILNNTISTTSSEGIDMRDSDDNTIAGNAVSSPIEGIFLLGSDDNSIANNTVANSGKGLRFYRSDGNIITGNNFTNNSEEGLAFHSSGGTTITNNSIVGNEIGIDTIASTNSIYHNRFLYNSQQVKGSQSSWDNGYPSGGNYWSDYTGDDQKCGPNQDQPGSDGIGDEPYIIYYEIQDRYPLMVHGLLPASLPSAPLNLSRTFGRQHVSLNWEPPAFDGRSTIINYTVYRGDAPDAGMVLAELGGNLTYNDTDVVTGYAYYYSVSATNSVGEGPKSGEVIAKPGNLSPVCEIESPTSGAEVSGVILILGTADDPDGTVMSVEVRIDSRPWMQAGGNASWNMSWDTATISNGNRVIQARSYDGVNYSAEVLVTVFVNNTAPPPSHDVPLDMLWVWGAIVFQVVVSVAVLLALWLSGKRSKGEG